MKIKYFYILFLFFAVSIIYFALKKEKPKTELTLLERKGLIASSGEWLNTKAAIEKLLADIRSNPKNNTAKINLALAYIQESRVTGNHAYYDAAAMQLIEDLLSDNPNDFQALTAKATIQLSQHHFAEALETGNKVVKMNPWNAYSFGILTDANVELGKYDEAILSADKMVSLRPDIRSYSRVSYLREIFGDMTGAIDAMKMAVSSGVPGTEQTEWTRVYVGHIYEVIGKADSAEMQFKLTLSHRPNYPFAYAGLGRIAKAKSNYELAIKYFTLAKEGMADYSFNEELTDIYRAALRHREAEVELAEAINMLKTNNGNESASSHGHYSDRELALLYLKDYRYDLALQHAMTEYNRRPDNIEVNQTLAWVHYTRGEYDAANKKIDSALRTGSQNPILLFQAGLIKIKSGSVAEGRNLLHQSLAINPYPGLMMKLEMERALGKSDLAIANL
jgi:tetratricopeptide (TPR) repeat protein